MKDLPVNGRDYTKLIFLNPGVAGSPDQISDSPGSYGEMCIRDRFDSESSVCYPTLLFETAVPNPSWLLPWTDEAAEG